MKLRFCFSIRPALALLVATCLVPASLIAITLLSYDYQQARKSKIDSSITTARTIVYSVDKEFSNTEATLRALATSPTLFHKDLKAFYQQAHDVQQSGQIQNIALFDPSGTQIFNTLRPLGARLPSMEDRTHLRLLADTNGLVISKLVKHSLTGKPVIILSIPVHRSGKHFYNISAAIFPDQLSELLQRQQLPPDWIVAVLDSDATLVARTHEMQRFMGKQAAPDLLSAMSFDNEGGFDGQTSELTPVLAVFSRSGISNWSVAIGIPYTSISAELYAKLGWLSIAIGFLLVTSLAVASVIGKKIAESVRALRAPALALGKGLEVVIPSLQLREADDVAIALKQAWSTLYTAQHQATHDVLTDLANRGLFNKLVNQQIAISKRADTFFSLLFIDLDGFKPVNDIYGHAAGDEILCEVARRLRKELRESDTAARLGGDEFAVILVGTPSSGAKKVADKLLGALSKPYHFDGTIVRVSASIGIACYPEAGTTDHELLRIADDAMYDAKGAGKGQVVCALAKPHVKPCSRTCC